MERELRLKAFMEEYARIVQLFDDIVSMKESMTRLETYMIIMVCQVAGAMIAVSLFLLFRFCQEQKQRGEYELEHSAIRRPIRIERSLPDEKKPRFSDGGQSIRTVHFSDSTESCTSGAFASASFYSLSSLKSPSKTTTHPVASPPPPLTGNSSDSTDSTPSYSSIPTIDRTISEDSLLVIKR